MTIFSLLVIVAFSEIVLSLNGGLALFLYDVMNLSETFKEAAGKWASD